MVSLSWYVFIFTELDLLQEFGLDYSYFIDMK